MKETIRKTTGVYALVLMSSFVFSVNASDMASSITGMAVTGSHGISANSDEDPCWVFFGGEWHYICNQIDIEVGKV